MNLKDAFRYQSRLQTILNELSNYAISDSMKTELHKKSATIPNMADETIDVSSDGKRFDCSTETIIKCIYAVVQEKIELNRAIYKAKYKLMATQGIDIDRLTVNNKILQGLQDTLYVLANKKESTYKQTGVAYTINNEGNQVTYNYPVECTVKYDYNQSDIRKIHKNLAMSTNETSDNIASYILSTKLENFIPAFDCSDDATNVIHEVINGTKYSNFTFDVSNLNCI